MLGIESSVAALYLDKAVYLWGSEIEEDIRKSTEKKSKKQIPAIVSRVLAKYLYQGKEGENIKGRFRDPMEFVKKKR